MAIISFSKDTIIDYVPEYGGNRDSENPCVVRLKFVPYSKVQEYSKIISAKAKGDMSKAADISREIQKRQFCESVDSVSGFSVDGCEVTTSDEFYEHAPTELVYEIIRAMESSAKLSEGQRKNS